MEDADMIAGERYHRAFDHLLELSQANKWDEFERQANQLLDEDDLPYHFYIRIWVLFGQHVKEWDEANEYHGYAERLWQQMARCVPMSMKSAIEEDMAELKEMIDTLRDALDEALQEEDNDDGDDKGEEDQRIEQLATPPPSSLCSSSRI